MVRRHKNWDMSVFADAFEAFEAFKNSSSRAFSRREQEFCHFAVKP